MSMRPVRVVKNIPYLLLSQEELTSSASFHKELELEIEAF